MTTHCVKVRYLQNVEFSRVFLLQHSRERDHFFGSNCLRSNPTTSHNRGEGLLHKIIMSYMNLQTSKACKCVYKSVCMCVCVCVSCCLLLLLLLLLLLHCWIQRRQQHFSSLLFSWFQGISIMGILPMGCFFFFFTATFKDNNKTSSLLFSSLHFKGFPLWVFFPWYQFTK